MSILISSLLAHKPAPTRFCISCPQNCPCPQVTSQCPNLVVTSQSLSSRSQQRLTGWSPFLLGTPQGLALAWLPSHLSGTAQFPSPSLLRAGSCGFFFPRTTPLQAACFTLGALTLHYALMTPTVLSPSRGSPELHTRGPAASRHLHFDIDKAPQTQYVLTIPRYLRSCSSYRKWKLHHSRCSLHSGVTSLKSIPDRPTSFPYSASTRVTWSSSVPSSLVSP